MSKFKVGDRVRYIEGTYTFGKRHAPTPTEGRIVSAPDNMGDYTIHFEEWGKAGQGWGHGDFAGGHWFLREDQIELASPAAKFQVVYIEDGDETFDTLAAAENAAEERAENAIGSKVAVVKVLAVASVTCKIERFA